MTTDNPTTEHIVGKAELALALDWSRPRLDRRIATDSRFPVIARGAPGQAWRFDLNAVRAHLDAEEQLERVRSQSRGLTARERLDLAIATRLERQNREERARYVETAAMLEDLRFMFAFFRAEFGKLPATIVDRLRMAPEAAPVIAEMLEDMIATAERDIYSKIPEPRP